MIEYLSDEWFAEASRLLPEPSTRPEEGAFVLQQVVEHPSGGGPVVWHLAVAAGEPHLVRGPHPSPDVTFTCDRPTAWAVHQGELSPQAAFMSGQLRLGGDTTALLAHQASLRAVEDRLGPLRVATAVRTTHTRD